MIFKKIIRRIGKFCQIFAEMNKTFYFAKLSHFDATGRRCGKDRFFLI